MTTLTMKDEKRLEVIQRVYRKELTVGQAALVMGLSERQCYRVKARVIKAGAKGVVHGHRGRPYKRRLKDSTVWRVLELARGKYQSFNDHHLTEKLNEQEQISVATSKVTGGLFTQAESSWGYFTDREDRGFDSTTTHTIGLYRTHGKTQGLRYGPNSMLTTQPNRPT